MRSEKDLNDQSRGAVPGRPMVARTIRNIDHNLRSTQHPSSRSSDLGRSSPGQFLEPLNKPSRFGLEPDSSGLFRTTNVHHSGASVAEFHRLPKCPIASGEQTGLAAARRFRRDYRARGELQAALWRKEMERLNTPPRFSNVCDLENCPSERYPAQDPAGIQTMPDASEYFSMTTSACENVRESRPSI